MAEIRHLPLRYAYGYGTQNWPLLESLGVKANKPVEPPTIDYHRIHRTEHKTDEDPTRAWSLFVGNHLITLDGADHAHGAVYCHAMFGSAERFTQQMICYQDVYERREGTWLFV